MHNLFPIDSSASSSSSSSTGPSCTDQSNYSQFILISMDPWALLLPLHGNSLTESIWLLAHRVSSIIIRALCNNPSLSLSNQLTLTLIRHEDSPLFKFPVFTALCPLHTNNAWQRIIRRHGQSGFSLVQRFELQLFFNHWTGHFFNSSFAYSLATLTHAHGTQNTKTYDL